MMPTVDNFRSLFGVLFLLGLAWLASSARNKIPIKTVLAALGLQIAVAAVIFAIPPVRMSLAGISDGLKALQAATAKGTQFVFGYLGGGGTPFEMVMPENNFILAFQVLPLMIVISALAAMFWHWGILEKICEGMGFLMRKTLGLSGPASLGAAASVFLGMVEAPMVVRPYLERMSRADIFLLMTAAMSTVAGTVMAIYIALMQTTVPEAAAHVIVASFMAAPGAVAIARIMQPPDGERSVDDDKPPPKFYQSTMDAFTRGVQEGVNIFISVLATAVVAVAFIAILDMSLDAFAPDVGGAPVTMNRLFGWILSPLMYMLGIPWKDAAPAGMLLGTKTTINELIAFISLSELPEGSLEPRTRMMMIYVLCGFANFGAVAIMVSGLSAMCPSRRPDFLDLGMKSLGSGTLTNLLNGTLLGCVPFALLSSAMS